MIYITGDCHSDFRRFTKENFPEQKELTKDDYVIICGDFGGVWDVGWESKNEKWWMNWLEELPFTTLFIDGNHENFDRLNGYPIEEWHGGKVHKIRPSVIHLMRGQVYEICGKKFFAFGGAASHDIYAGVLDTEDENFAIKKKQLDKEHIFYRINHISWWKEELASKEEMEEGRHNLKMHENTVDYIITHCCASSTLKELDPEFTCDIQSDYLEELKKEVKYKRWFFGHYHMNDEINEKEIALYEQIVRIV